jgi:hypothetical protein
LRQAVTHTPGGLYGIKFDVFGKPNANYSLLVAPAFEINMRVAQFGPELRYMTHMSVLYHGKSISFDPWALQTRKAELIAHFESRLQDHDQWLADDDRPVPATPAQVCRDALARRLQDQLSRNVGARARLPQLVRRTARADISVQVRRREV